MQAVLDGASDLFCSIECESKYSVRSSTGSLRRQIFQLERGVCQLCKLDCHRLVESLKCEHGLSLHNHQCGRSVRVIMILDAHHPAETLCVPARSDIWLNAVASSGHHLYLSQDSFVCEPHASPHIMPWLDSNPHTSAQERRALYVLLLQDH